MKTFIINKNESGQTIYKYVQKVLPNVPLGKIYKLFRKKDIKINGHWVNLNTLINENDKIDIYINYVDELPKKEFNISNAKEFEKMIIYEDDNLIIVNKKRGLLVQKDTPSLYQKSLDMMLLDYLANKKEYDPLSSLGFTPGPCHRLDRNTSGILVMAKNLLTSKYFWKLLKEKNDIIKSYYGLVLGDTLNSGEINLPIKKIPLKDFSIIASISEGGKDALTKYQVIKKYQGYTLLELTLFTGRTHQIRVHLAANKTPLIGDRKYGDFNENKKFKEKYNFENQFLHAYKITFKNLEGHLKYLSNKSFCAPLDEKEQIILSKLENIN